jgi:sec-independent protein translocase protein TatA
MFEGAFQPMHLLVVLFIIVLLFGPKRLPELGKGLGESIRGFRQSLREGTEPAEGEAPAAERDESAPPR